MCVRGYDSSKKAECCVTWGLQFIRSNLFKKHYSPQEAENAVISQRNHPVDIHIFQNAHAAIAWPQQTLLQETLEIERTTQYSQQCVRPAHAATSPTHKRSLQSRHMFAGRGVAKASSLCWDMKANQFYCTLWTFRMSLLPLVSGVKFDKSLLQNVNRLLKLFVKQPKKAQLK